MCIRDRLIAQCYAVYLRKEFLVSDTAEIAAAILHMDYDDGFVAYINGFEIARAGVVGCLLYTSRCV